MGADPKTSMLDKWNAMPKTYGISSSNNLTSKDKEDNRLFQNVIHRGKMRCNSFKFGVSAERNLKQEILIKYFYS